jgi:hypothetical protein
MFGAGVITNRETLNKLESVPYNQEAGFGSTNFTTGMVTGKVNKEELIELLKNSATSKFDLAAMAQDTSKINNSNTDDFIYSNGNQLDNYNNISIETLLSDNRITFVNCSSELDSGGDTRDQFDGKYNESWQELQNNFNNSGFLNWMIGSFGNVLAVDTYSQNALNYAANELSKVLSTSSTQDADYLYNHGSGASNSTSASQIRLDSVNKAKSTIGFASATAWRSDDLWHWMGGSADVSMAASINLNNLADAFLTYYASYMNGLSDDTYTIDRGARGTQRLVTDDYTYRYLVNKGQVTDADTQKEAF